MTSTSNASDGWQTEDTYYYRASGGEPLSEAVVAAVAAFSDRSSVGSDADEALEPLYGTIDPDALDVIFRDTTDEPRSGTVEFAYSGHDVTVRSDGLVTVTEQ
ncbi:HalOD1 output domain-containing protein [Halorussus aquaticus]|uniref:HalOD1 output domain-containing protein n=1 Tax=Halorussus aquaticus TaxID=2953748 RepID=A0ABD5Q5B1_9EURY|nr:HalOD1 output domain-containing protein [Halorussus aquaticus]